MDSSEVAPNQTFIGRSINVLNTYAAAGAAGYYLWNREGLAIEIAPGGTTSTSELMAPGPLEEMIQGKADVVYGSRFLSGPHRVLFFWHSLGNRLLTLVSNIFTDLNLTDMETGFKAFRRDAKGVDSRFHRRNDEIPNAIGKSRLNNIGTCVGHGHGSAWHTRILRIDNAADEAALLYLRICEYGE